MNAMKEYENKAILELNERNVNIKQLVKIFKLNIDCVEETLGWLLLEDVISFGQTCKWFLQNAGVYFLRNYAATTDVLCEPDDLLLFRTSKQMKMNEFGEFIRRITIRCNELKCFERLEISCRSLQQIELVGIELTILKIQCLKKFHDCIEKIFLCECDVYVDFYEQFLKFFPNMKHLCVYQSTIMNNGYDWLTQKYPMLESLEFRQLNIGRCDELMMFFLLNSNVRNFATDYECLWENRDWIMTANIKLDDLAIEINMLTMSAKGKFEEFCCFLQRIHELGFYKRLNLYCDVFHLKQKFEQFNFLPALTKLNVGIFYGNLNLSSLPNVKELDLSYGNYFKLETTSTHFERVFIEDATFDVVLSLIQKSKTLRKIKINSLKTGSYFDDKVLDLITLNEERKRLKNTQKVSIYVEDPIFTATKWAMHEINLDLIEMKRSSSYNWNHFFFTY